MDKLREQYKAQKEEEETKRQFYHSPDTARREGTTGSDEDQLDDSMEMSSHSEQTPEPSPALNQQRERVGSDSREPMGRRVLPDVAPKPKVTPEVAPCPSKVTNGGNVNNPPLYNPYPPPAEAAPPCPKRHLKPSQPPTAAPTSPGVTPDKEALFAFAWYHGSISRDEALRRLDGVGGFDGSVC